MTGTAAGLAAPPSRPRSHAHLQALDDAIRYRTARLKAPCRKCRPSSPCDAHACDLKLLEAYHRMARDAIAALQGGGRRMAAGPHDATVAVARRAAPGASRA